MKPPRSTADRGAHLLASGIAIGAGVGAALGAATGSMGAWVGIGIGCGIALGAIARRRIAVDAERCPDHCR